MSLCKPVLLNSWRIHKSNFGNKALLTLQNGLQARVKRGVPARKARIHCASTAQNDMLIQLSLHRTHSLTIFHETTGSRLHKLGNRYVIYKTNYRRYEAQKLDLQDMKDKDPATHSAGRSSKQKVGRATSDIKNRFLDLYWPTCDCRCPFLGCSEIQHQPIRHPPCLSTPARMQRLHKWEQIQRADSSTSWRPMVYKLRLMATNSCPKWSVRR